MQGLQATSQPCPQPLSVQLLPYPQPPDSGSKAVAGALLSVGIPGDSQISAYAQTLVALTTGQYNGINSAIAAVSGNSTAVIPNVFYIIDAAQQNGGLIDDDSVGAVLNQASAIAHF